MNNLWPTWIPRASLACLLSCVPLYAAATDHGSPQAQQAHKTSLEELDCLSRIQFVEHRPEYASVKENLGILYRKEQKPAQALFYLLFFVALQARQRGPENPQSLLAYYHLFKTYQELGASQSARYYADKIQAILARYSAKRLKTILKIPIQAKKSTTLTLTRIARATQNVDPTKSAAKPIPPPSAFPITFPKAFQDYTLGDTLLLVFMYALCLAGYCIFLYLTGIGALDIRDRIRNKTHDYSAYAFSLLGCCLSLGMAWLFGAGICFLNEKITCTQESIALPKRLGSRGFFPVLLTGLCWFFFLRSSTIIPYAHIRKVVIENKYRVEEKREPYGHNAEIVRKYPVPEYKVTFYATVRGVEKVYTVHYQDLCESSDPQTNLIPQNFFLFLKLLAMQDVPITFAVHDLQPALHKAFKTSTSF